jgi:hypothetical protein
VLLGSTGKEHVMKLYAIFRDGTRKEIDLDSAGVQNNASKVEALVQARKELTILEEKNLAGWEFEEEFL